MSAGAHAPNGIANESGQVGRHFMETVAWFASGLHPEALGSHRGLPADAICWDYNAPDAIKGVTGGCRFTPGMAEANLIGPINYARRVVGGPVQTGQNTGQGPGVVRHHIGHDR